LVWSGVDLAFYANRTIFDLTAICLDWPMDAADRIGKISLEDVNRVLKATLSESNVRWFSLRPAKKVLLRRM